MPIEKEYYQYLNQVWAESLTAAANDKEQARVFFDKAASPYHYWKEAQLLSNGQPGQPKPKLTPKQAETIRSFIKNHPELAKEITQNVDDINKEDASKIIGDWMKKY